LSTKKRLRVCRRAALAVFIIILTAAASAEAYIGPGAGFAIVGSFMAFFFAFVAAFMSILIWPIRALYIFIRRLMLNLKPSVKRVIVLGLDGLDPKIATELMDAGKLPNFKKLTEQGYFRPLRTTTPSMSPVAWSTFMTGVNPGKHAIYDFLMPDRNTYLPVLSSSHVGSVERTIKLGKYIIPLGSPEIRLLRRSIPFWKILGDNYVFSQVLRVPITFPPEKFYGTCLSAMCVPDLKGTQGSFTFFTTRPSEDVEHTGGVQVRLEKDGNGGYKAHIPGPENPLVEGAGEMKIPIQLKNGTGQWKLVLPDQEVELKEGEYTDWVDLSFKAGLGVSAKGIGKFRLLRSDPDLDLYLTPINIDPRGPVMPVSHPPFFAGYLAKLQGPFATLGLAEDTWGLNERVLEEGAFLEQVWKIHEEREDMFFRTLETTRKGCVVCVFDTTDRIQHMFMRYRDPEHPANKDKDVENYAYVIDDLYIKMDELLGKVLEKKKEGDALLVMSDHGFTLFKRGMNLNSWLWKNGYMATKDGKPSGELFENVDWENTKAYSLGLSGIFLNIKGREGKGIVDPEDAPALRKEIAGKLVETLDEEAGVKAVEDAHVLEDTFHGPYAGQGPDLAVGFKPGWRISWDGALGVVDDTIFEDNVKGWSGDHCVDSKFVPGVLFSDVKFKEQDPWIGDIAPTILTMFGIEPPGHMDGKPLVDTTVRDLKPSEE